MITPNTVTDIALLARMTDENRTVHGGMCIRKCHSIGSRPTSARGGSPPHPHSSAIPDHGPPPHPHSSAIPDHGPPVSPGKDPPPFHDPTTAQSARTRPTSSPVKRRPWYPGKYQRPGTAPAHRPHPTASLAAQDEGKTALHTGWTMLCPVPILSYVPHHTKGIKFIHPRCEDPSGICVVSSVLVGSCFYVGGRAGGNHGYY